MLGDVPWSPRPDSADLDATAVVDHNGRHTFREILDRSARIAARLLGGRRDLDEARVGYSIAPGVDHVAAIFGIWRAGGIAVPIGHGHPIPEIRKLIRDCTPSTILVDDWRLDPLAASGHSPPLVSITDASRATPVSLPAVTDDRRAMIVYTSGTTGSPKGVVTTFRQLRAQIEAQILTWRWVAADRMLDVLPLHHIHGIVNAMLTPLAAGASVEFLTFDPEVTWERLASGDVTVFTAVPTIYHRLIGEHDRATAATQSRWANGSRGLRLMMSGSAALPTAILDRWAAITGQTLLERYGMTEIGMALSNPLEGPRVPGSVGWPMPGVEVALTDDNGDPVGDGTPGEICVRGPQIFREYWGRAPETAAAHRGGWFLTGDTAVREANGYRILGRTSVDILKSGGFKISALEIENVMREHPVVVDCVVVGLPDTALGDRICAAVIGAPSTFRDEPALTGWLRARLAPYKVPRTVRFVNDLPRTSLGKVNKVAVRQLLERAEERDPRR